ncbi:hypothetical protein D0809_12190 [Flavobacterium circumlabens]|uniref:Uncharacterized protein n=1 Tax=Flavobacterium circumlabens TaxID=2133765 RepID=A0A4Y7UDP7_9FLAO|nr:hypothetical protein EV142_103558 [Flavobacterium circumlabens]TEB44496.1 hypothetical protein D0809_12190 [Flavobacterium circumlabens]
MVKMIFKYYFDVNFFNLIYSFLLSLLFFNFYFMPIIFASIGTILGVLSFQYFYGNEYYFYHNKGFTKKRLNLIVLFLNVFISIIVSITYQLIK